MIGTFSTEIYYPGLETRQLDRELYNVRAQGSITINIEPGDRLIIGTDHGGQYCDVFA